MIYRRPAVDPRPPLEAALAEEEVARDHMLVRHELEPEVAVAALMEAVGR